MTAAWTMWLCVFAAWSLHNAQVHARPWQNYAVELNQCDTSYQTVSPAEQCTSLCEPIRTAQQTCDGDLACTCEYAPPSAVQECITCHMSSGEEASQKLVHVARAMSSYADLCGDATLSSRNNATSASDDPHETQPESDDKPLARRELYGSECIYGVPAISELAPSSHPAFHINDQRLLYAFAFCLVVVLCLIERRRN